MTKITAQIKTSVGPPSPDEYFNDLAHVEYEKFSDGRTEVAHVGSFHSLDELYSACDHNTVVIGKPGTFDMGDVDFVVTVYDGYLE